MQAASVGQTCRQTLSFHIVPNYKYPVAQQQLGPLSWRSSFRCFGEIVRQRTGSSAAGLVNKLLSAGWLRHSLAVCGAFCCIWRIICSLITLVPPLTSKPLRGMKWMAEWIDVYPFPLVHIHLAYRKNRMGKLSVSGHHPNTVFVSWSTLRSGLKSLKTTIE